ncbi:bifunctional diguanylate cyclase/phosphodiesterase [Paenibacillus lutrae]|nr:bifunctional diguanylate cyclase/phosphodiesterase [Paenibacillus lutrae]
MTRLMTKRILFSYLIAVMSLQWGIELVGKEVFGDVPQAELMNGWIKLAALALACGLGSLLLFRRVEAAALAQAAQGEQEADDKIRATLDSIKDGYYETDIDGHFTFFSQSLSDLLGVSAEELGGSHYSAFMNETHAEKLRQTFEWVQQTDVPVNCVEWEVLGDGRPAKFVESSIVLINGIDGGAPSGFRGIIRDITERRDSEIELEESRNRYKSLYEHNPDLVCSFSLDGRLLSANPATETITGYDTSKLLGSECEPFMKQESVARTVLYFRRARNGESSSFEMAILHKKGHPVELQVRLVPIIVGGEVVGVFGIGKDITEQKISEQTINHLAYHDALTDLPNRRLFQEKLSLALKHAICSRQKLALMFLDLDRFKYINDSMGHNFGDQLLQIVAKRLTGCLQGQGMIARMGGDEFTILLPVVQGEEEVETLVRSIIQSINRPFMIAGQECSVTTSIGISMYPDDGADVSMLMKNADAAMYRAKEKNPNAYEWSTPSMSADALERHAIEQELRKAGARNEFVLHYQPQVNLGSGEVVGIEALLRWDHPTRGMVSPAEFIPLAEETGLIVGIGEWVLRTACRQNKEWQLAGYQPVRMAVNLSVSQFMQDNIVEIVSGILEETGLEPRYLELEITESVAMRNADKVSVKLEKLKNLGLQISIDDFGTGYSSLSYLQQFPINRLKIDRSFVNKVTQSEDDAVIASSIIAMAQSLKLEVIAEGVETAEQFDFLRRRACTEMQGYFFSRPLPAGEIVELLRCTEEAEQAAIV